MPATVPTRPPAARTHRLRSFTHWIDTAAPIDAPTCDGDRRIDWARVAPFVAIMVVLLLRPQGLLGGKLQVKKV